jgi:hypothetical protein
MLSKKARKRMMMDMSPIVSLQQRCQWRIRIREKVRCRVQAWQRKHRHLPCGKK